MYNMSIYQQLPKQVKEYLSSDIEDIVKLGVDYVNNNIEALLRFDCKEIKNNKYKFNLNQIHKDLISPNNYKLGFWERPFWDYQTDSLMIKDPTRVLKLKPNPIK